MAHTGVEGFMMAQCACRALFDEPNREKKVGKEMMGKVHQSKRESPQWLKKQKYVRLHSYQTISTA
jgi:hypothetical protein